MPKNIQLLLDKATVIIYFRIGYSELQSSGVNGSDDIKYETSKARNFFWRSCSKSVFEKAYKQWEDNKVCKKLKKFLKS